MPLVGDILVAGRTPEELSNELEDTIGRFVEMARVTVAIEQPNSVQFFVLGKVAQQGAFPYTRPIRIAHRHRRRFWIVDEQHRRCRQLPPASSRCRHR